MSRSICREIQPHLRSLQYAHVNQFYHHVSVSLCTLISTAHTYRAYRLTHLPTIQLPINQPALPPNCMPINPSAPLYDSSLIDPPSCRWICAPVHLLSPLILIRPPAHPLVNNQLITQRSWEWNLEWNDFGWGCARQNQVYPEDCIRRGL